MQTVCVSSNWPSVEALHPRQLDIFVHGWQDDCPPPDVNGAAPAVTAPAVPGQGVGTIGPVLVGCEESQVVTSAFRAAGFEAYSCDLVPTRGRSDWHFQADICEVIPLARWSLVVLHPDCTKMAVSGNRWYGSGSPRYQERLDAIAWTLDLWRLAKLHSHRVALENPVSVVFRHLDAPVSYVQPYEHGHGETKRTGFALHNLPPLRPSRPVSGRSNRVWRMAPSPTRKRDRSETFSGVARALVDQWGPCLVGSPG